MDEAERIHGFRLHHCVYRIIFQVESGYLHVRLKLDVHTVLFLSLLNRYLAKHVGRPLPILLVTDAVGCRLLASQMRARGCPFFQNEMWRNLGNVVLKLGAVIANIDEDLT